ncbi:MAG: hypothetical protein ACRD0K_22215 [Egibacteraceae bacterium]
MRLPEPTGPHDVGVGSVRLVGPARPDPWRPDRKRELMVSIWYPARGVERLPLVS